MDDIEVVVSIYSDDEESPSEYVKIDQIEPIVGLVRDHAYLTISDDGDGTVVFLADQIDDIIAAMQEARVGWLAAGGK